MRIGIFGGTFDPIHLGHLRCAEEACEQLGLDTVWFVPAADPPHKTRRRIAPAADRLAMTRLAVAGNPRFSVSTIEIERVLSGLVGHALLTELVQTQVGAVIEHLRSNPDALEAVVSGQGQRFLDERKAILRRKTAAAALGISVNTISFHLKHIYEKLQVHSKSEAVAKALRERII